MRTDDLIADLSDRLEPVRYGALTRMLVLAIGVGVIGSTILMLSTLGLRHDLARAIVGFGMWTKLVYTFAIAALGFWLVQRAGHPGADMARPARILILPVLALVPKELTATADGETALCDDGALSLAQGKS